MLGKLVLQPYLIITEPSLSNVFSQVAYIRIPSRNRVDIRDGDVRYSVFPFLGKLKLQRTPPLILCTTLWSTAIPVVLVPRPIYKTINLFVSYACGCETWLLALRRKHTFRVFREQRI
jgi:hypothetical protein